MELQKIHKDSYDYFTNQALKEILKDFFAQLLEQFLDDNGIKLEFTEIRFKSNKYEEYCKKHGKIYDEQFCWERKLTFSEVAEISYTIEDRGQLDAKTVQLNLPRMTANESFVINGTSMYLIPQLAPSPGFFCYTADRKIVASIRPESGYEIEIVCSDRTSKEPSQKRIRREILFKKVGAKKTLFSLLVDEFLDAIDEQQVIFSDEWRRKTAPENYLLYVFPESTESTEPNVKAVIEQARLKLFDKEFFDFGEAGRKYINNTLYKHPEDKDKEEYTGLTKQDLLYAIQQLYALLNPDVEPVIRLQWNTEVGNEAGIFWMRPKAEDGNLKKDEGICTILPEKGEAIQITISTSGKREVTLESWKTPLPLNTFLFIVGITEYDINAHFEDVDVITQLIDSEKQVDIQEISDNIRDLWKEDDKQEEKEKREKNVDKVYKKLFPDKKKGKLDTDEKIRQIREQVESWLKSSELTRLGRWQVNRRLNRLDDAAKKDIPNIDYQDKDDYIKKSIETRLSLPDVLGAIRYFAKVLEGEIDLDDFEHLDNQKVVRVGDYLENQLRTRLSQIAIAFAKSFGKKKSNSKEEIDELIKAIGGFLNNRLSAINLPQMMIPPYNPTGSCRYLFHTNVLYDATEKRRITKLGWRGVQGNEFYIPQKRDIHWSYYGSICPVDTPQSGRIGLVLSLAIYAKVDELGRVSTPYWKVTDGKVSKEEKYYLLASEEEELKDDDGKQKWIAYADQTKPCEENQLKDTLQARRGGEELVEKSKSEIAYIDIGAEQPFSLAANLIPFLRHDDPNRALMACSAMKQALPLKQPEKPLIRTGFEAVAVRESNQAIIALQDGKISVIDGETVKINPDRSYSIYRNLPTLAKTVREHRVAVNDGDSIEAGDLLADCATSDEGQLALGKNLLVAFMPWFGWNFEDAIVISERLQKEAVFTSIHCYEHEYVVTCEIYHADEAKLKEVLRKRLRAALNEEIQKKAEKRGEEAARRWFNTRFSRLCQSREIVYRCLVKDQGEVNEPIPFVEVVYRKKPKNRTKQHGIPDEIASPKFDSKQPIGISGTVDVKVYDNPDELPFNVKKIFRFRIRSEKPIQVGDKLSNRHGNKGVVSKILPQAKMPFLYVNDDKGNRVRRHVDVLLNPLGIPSRQNLGQLYETHFGWFAERYNSDGYEAPFISPYDEKKLEELSQADDTLKNGKVELHYQDEESGEERKIENPITVGYMYLMKLNHNAADKINVRGYGGYSQTTEQPLKGRRLRGGQRMGVMETWALWAHNVPSLLYEMLCVKSDDALGKKKLREQPPKLDDFTDYHNFPESIRMFIFFLRSLGLSPIFGKNGKDVTDEILKRVGLTETGSCTKEAKPDFDQITLKIATPDEIEGWAFCKMIGGTSALDEERAFRFTLKKEEVFSYLKELAQREHPDIEKITPEFPLLFDALSQKYLLDKSLEELNQLDKFLKEKIEKELFAVDIGELHESLDFNIRIYPSLGSFQSLLEHVELLRQWAGTYHMGCIDLSETPVLNPLFYLIYKRVLNVLSKLAEDALKEILPDIKNHKNFLNEVNKSPESRGEFLKGIQLEPLIAHLEEGSGEDKQIATANMLLTDLRNLKEKYNAETLDLLLLKRLPVLPPKYRPKHKIESGRITSLYLTKFYERILINQVKGSSDSQGKKNKWQQIEKQVFGLFQNRYIYNPMGQLEKSLESFLKGKTGIFRRNLLGKRSDFSARATIVVDPTLDIDECSLPETIAVPLFEPLIWCEINEEYPGWVIDASRLLEALKFNTMLPEEIQRLLTDSMCKYPVLLNRNPTLHRMGIMGFNARLKQTDSHTISINPLVTTPFGADFDGDQMALFVPMLDGSSEDVRRMMAQNHIFSPANGNLLVSISQDIVLGCYLHSKTKKGREELAKILGCPVPEEPLLQRDLVSLIEDGNTDILECLAQLKNLGFRVATEHGCTYSLWDLWGIAMERGMLEKMESEEQIDEEIKETLAKKDNSVAWIFLSGARGNRKQMRKMVGGVWEIESIDPKREPRIIRSNLTHGLSVGEYVYAVYEGRKTQVDQQLATPRAGWLTRKLIYATQRLTIAEEDCQTDQCLPVLKKKIEQYNLIGRWYKTADGELKEVTPDELDRIQKSEKQVIYIRSPIFCQSKKGICRMCYGWDLSTKTLVETCAPVGIIASQSIGERATQTSLSARHGGGIENDLEGIIKFFNGESPEVVFARGKLEKGANVRIVAGYLLSKIFAKFNRKVDIKHFEVVLRLMRQQDMEPRIVLGLTEIIRGGPGWLTNLAFERPFSALRNAAIEQADDALEGPLENLLVSHFK